MRTFQLFAHTAVWRVIEIVHITTEDRLMTGRVGYRWTLKGATKLRDRWLKESSGGRFAPGFLIQGGIVTWYPDDEWDAAVDATDWNREQNVDDRAAAR